MHFIEQFLEEITSEKIPIRTCGNINIDVIPKKSLKSKLFNAMEGISLKMISNDATKITHISRTYIDHDITQNFDGSVNVPKQQGFFDQETLLATWFAHTSETNF